MDDHWLAGELHLSDSSVKRFGPDEHDDADWPKSFQFDTQIPGGFGSGSVVLPRPPTLRADDAALFSHARFYGPMGTVYEGIVSGIPQVGVNEIRLELDGWAEILTADETLREIFVDQDLSAWGGAAGQRRIDFATSDVAPVTDSSIQPDNSLLQQFSGAWGSANGAVSEAWYNGGGIPLGSVFTAGKIGSSLVGVIDPWHWKAALADTDAGAGTDLSVELRGLTWLAEAVATTATRRFAYLYFTYGAAGGADGLDFNILHNVVAVYGNHGVTKRGSYTQTEAMGFYASDIIAHVLDGYAPELNYTLGDSIEQSTEIIRHLVFREPVTPRAVIEQVTGLGGAQLVPNDWGVYENREFFHKTPGTYGRTWRVRRDQVATPTSEGPQSKKRAGGFMISYRDGGGASHSVGPPGSGAEYETTELLDTDPQNPANRLTRKWRHEQIGILGGNKDQQRQAAINIGRMMLTEANRADWRGTIEIQGEATDAAGNTYPTSEVRAGDRVVVEDEQYPEEHPVNSTSYDGDSLVVRVNDGEPPNTLEVFLAQLEAATDLIAA